MDDGRKRPSPLIRPVSLAALSRSFTARANETRAAFLLPRRERMIVFMKLTDWYFYRGALEDGFQFSADMCRFEKIQIPHTWNAADGQDGCPGGKDINETDYYRGDGWYRTTLTLSAESLHKRHFLRFEGANMRCDVFLNEQLIGSHEGGYTAFCLEITDVLREGGNLLAVKVNNAFSQRIAPLTADFTFYGGLYREVELIETEKLCFSRTQLAARGLRLIPSSVSDASASCRVEATLENREAEEKTIRVRARFGDSVQTKTIQIASGQNLAIGFDFRIDRPHLWNGREDPYLYSASMELSANGETIDTLWDEAGLRYFHIDREKGFFLNGRPYPLRGVSRHQDREALGNALTEAQHDEDFQILYDIGATAVRLAHYPQAEYFYRLCDRHGILVWAEIPFVDLVGGNGSYENPNTDREAFFEITKQQLTELIEQNRNHPAIFCWGLQNEVKAQFDDVMIPFTNELHALAKRLDPTRYTTQATNQKTAYHWKSDLIAWNIYPGWYGMNRRQLGSFLDKMRCDRPVGISEYGAGGNHLQHAERPKKPLHNGSFHPEEYQTLCHESFLRQIDRRDYLWATFVWNLFDFGSDGRNEGNRPGMNDKGLVSFDRKVKKDAYYVYQSRWSKTPMLQIAQSRCIQRKRAKTEIKVYSNTDAVTLFVNGKQISTKEQKKNKQPGIFRWKGCRLQKGKNKIIAIARAGSKELKSEAIWILAT